MTLPDDTNGMWLHHYKRVVDQRDYYRRRMCELWWATKLLEYHNFPRYCDLTHMCNRMAAQRGFKGWGE